MAHISVLEVKWHYKEQSALTLCKGMLLQSKNYFSVFLFITWSLMAKLVPLPTIVRTCIENVSIFDHMHSEAAVL